MKFKASAIEIEHFSFLPCHVYWKDTKGTYLGYNDFGAKRLGFKNATEVTGHSDFEIFPQSIAIEFVNNDKKITALKTAMLFPENGVLKKALKVIFISYKMPIFDLNESLIGILGLSFTRPPKTPAHPSSYQKFLIIILNLKKKLLLYLRWKITACNIYVAV